jgi:diacylglycerol kinase (CTP)
MATKSAPIPATPRVISPTPTPSETSIPELEYFGHVTRSITKSAKADPEFEAPLDEEEDGGSSDELKRARTRSRSPIHGARRRIPSALTPVKSKTGQKAAKGKGRASEVQLPNGNGYLSPPAVGSSYWRSLSRSPSPLGLIPIHQHWRSFVGLPLNRLETDSNVLQIHKHEIPRKVLHSSIGFITISLMVRGFQTTSITPVLLTLFIPIASVDVLRHQYPSINKIYVRSLGALMRETEVDGYNGVIWYLLGAWTVLRWFPKDVGVMGVLLLSWCDTAASTFGRLYGRYTIRLRRGKSLAGTLAAFAIGTLTAAIYWGWLVPWIIRTLNDPVELYMFQGTLILPEPAKALLGLNTAQASINGGLALAVVSLYSGAVGALSELVDVFNWDDNFTIPVLSGAGLWTFFKAFT